jgi:hypothetical protein
MATVHEEVQRLPDAERTAFVLCDLEGVRQPDAAARLGWPLGTLSGRLCKARQRLLEQLSRRGVAPGVLAVGGLAGAAGTVPAALVEQVTSFPTAAAAGVSSTVAALARGLVEGTTMRTKVLAAALLVAGAIGVYFLPRRKSPLQLAALTAALLLGLQIVLTHWFYLYLPWFFPFAAFAVLAPAPAPAPVPAPQPFERRRQELVGVE